ncbi:dithiol-disulfide isomerase [Streptomyces sp. NPDC052682]|uniref:DsbA family oxidoreductase n=1 Tax=Streptomyces sp. NPDC052682 TaxID=3154954 RepID=UPI00341C840B
MTSTMTNNTLIVYSDIGCPWASLALFNLRRAAAREGVDLAVDHRAFPLELFNSRPTPKWILDPEVAAVADCEPALGWTGWQGPESGYPVTMLPAMEAVQAVKTQPGPPRAALAASDQLDAALRHAFYAESRCISVHTEIMAVAEDCPLVDTAHLDGALRRGTSRQALFDQWEEAKAPEVRGSPHFFLPDSTGLHNPGITFTWPKGTPQPSITDYAPTFWTSLVRTLNDPAPGPRLGP